MSASNLPILTIELSNPRRNSNVDVGHVLANPTRFDDPELSGDAGTGHCFREGRHEFEQPSGGRTITWAKHCDAGVVGGSESDGIREVEVERHQAPALAPARLDHDDV